MKQDLIEQLRRSGIESAEHRVETSDEDAIDLVGMLFQFVVQDRNLPAEIQAVLSRLQIPYVRVAIKDRHLFAQRTHPARKLLDTLAVSSVAWSREADRDGRYLKALTQVVGYLIMENGVFVFGLSQLERVPFLVEVGVLLDIFVGVFIMGIVVFHINREFDSIDSARLTELHD